MENRAYQDSDRAPAQGLSFLQRMKSGLSTAVGAAAALGIIFALGIWFYRLGDRDARSVPIIRAETGPTKKIPDDPGGKKTPHQGILSYEAANGGTATAAAAVITADPPDPKPEDVAMGTLAPREKPSEDAEAARKTEETGRLITAPEPPEGGPKRVKAPTSDDTEVAAAPDAATTAPERPDAASADNAETPDVEAETETEATVPDEEIIFPDATALAPDRSPFAPRRPRNLTERHKEAAKVAVTEKNDLVAEAARSPVQIQLVADPNRQAVIDLWKKVYRENVDILQGKALSLQSTVSGGVTWYRLRVGPFGSRDEAASVCQALKARSQDCIVSRNS